MNKIVGGQAICEYCDPDHQVGWLGAVFIAFFGTSGSGRGNVVGGVEGGGE